MKDQRFRVKENVTYTKYTVQINISIFIDHTNDDNFPIYYGIR